ncbi:MerR family transcriptional regulator [Anaerocolumna sp. AGMB13025]|uniref:MerR family transcriptional regulator n=1 Tax=Anaerocolumna sp. AGMB13025 TaxID=3039116 RepID=UPI00241E8CD5|nr:MerR family transcriptional regulator [Anaerocolumna sp. AGMB13025]WFR56892.1 MerR family transcriptional regulator [Anaerocolumna sp. AGMB13025]
MSKELYSIGEFSKLCGISIQTLRYYDKIELLRPKFTDVQSGYRFYNNEQITIIKITQKMRTLGLSLDEIKLFLLRNDMVKIKLLLEEKRKEIEEKMNELLYADKSLELHIENINLRENIDFTSITVKKTYEKKVIYLRKEIELDNNGFTKLFNEFEKLIGAYKYYTVGNPMVIYYSDRILGEACDIELCMEIKDNCTPEIEWRQLERGYFLTKMHLGDHMNKPKTYDILYNYAKNNNLLIVGNPIEVCYIDISITKNTDDFITEIQIPVKNMLTL